MQISRGHRVRSQRILVELLVLLAIATIAVTPTAAAGELHYRYVANRSTGSVFLAIAEHQLGSTGGDWSLDGVTFLAEGSTFLLTVDDAAMAAPLTVPVLVIDTGADGQRRFRSQCVPNRRPSKIDVGRPGSSVTLLVFNHSETPWAGCSLGSGGTTGTLTIVP